MLNLKNKKNQSLDVISMKVLIFICSNILLLYYIIKLWKSNIIFIGISLSKKDLTYLLAFELLLLSLCYLDFWQISNNHTANDFIWNSLIIFYRGVLPIAGLMAVFDFELTNPISMWLLMLFGVILFDYILLRLITFVKAKLSTA
jgi:hypothetical protein